jgi:hypothetical protein
MPFDNDIPASWDVEDNDKGSVDFIIEELKRSSTRLPKRGHEKYLVYVHDTKNNRIRRNRFGSIS